MTPINVRHILLIPFLLRVALGVSEVDRCTTIAAGPGAGVDGPMVTHTADCSNCDFRVNKVPAKDWPRGSKRPLYVYRGEYPATISSDRGKTWEPSNLEGTPEQLSSWGTESLITGYIPQVEHTYALYEGGYGIMNEHQVAIGESTCASKFWGAPTIAGGKAMIEARELTRIALERCRTAREAVEMMGDLAVTYGFYAADWSGGDASLGEGGEALTVIDKNEAWIFHVMGDDTGTSAVWAAQRVPYGHVAAVANQFIIRKIDRYSPDIIHSANMYEVAKRNGLWKEEDGPLDFLVTFAPQRAHPTYCTRRIWRIFNLVAPSIQLPPETDVYGSDYPFSVPVDKPLQVSDLIRIQRDHYEGTPYDLTKGVAAGPYGDPNRFDPTPQPDDNLSRADIVKGSYERSISLFRTSYSFVANARTAVPDILALLWFSVYAPSSSSYTPLYIHGTEAPPSHTRGSLFKYDDNVAFWNFLSVGNYAARFYRYAMGEVITRQLQLEENIISAVNALEKKIRNTPEIWYATDKFIPELTAFSLDQAKLITTTWKNLLPEIITKYHDGYIAEDLTEPTINMKKLFYPKYWLDATGFFNSGYNHGDNVILFSNGPAGLGMSWSFFLSVMIMTIVLSVSGGMYMGRKYSVGNGWNRSAQPYEPIPEISI